ncbi:MAG: glycosyltransferase family 2 protein [Bacteroidota bacterium]
MISVITITYNRKDLLKNAVQSVLDQTFGDFEYIIVDDGSTDGTEQMIKSIDDKRIRYYHTEHCGYLSRLRNIGLDHATGEWIAFLDSDDTWHQSALEKMRATLQNYSSNSVVSNAFVIENGQTTSLFKKEPSFQLRGNLLQQKLLDNTFMVCTCCICFRNPGPSMRFNENMRSGDNDFFLRILSLGNTFVLTEELATIYRHPKNMTAVIAYEAPFIQAYYEDLESLKFLRQKKIISSLTYRQAASSCSYKLARNLLHLKRKTESRTNFLRAFLLFPLNFKALIKFFFSV